MSTNYFGTHPAISTSIAPKHRGRRAGSLGIVAGAAVALFLGGMGGTASAAPPGESTQAQVNVGSGITLFGLASNFALTGAPGETVGGGPGAFQVITNAVAGYDVTVEAGAATLVGTLLNTDTIPIASLLVENNVGDLTAVSATTPVTIFSHPGARSATLGDPITKAYSMHLPSVATDQYTVTINYLATIIGG